MARSEIHFGPNTSTGGRKSFDNNSHNSNYAEIRRMLDQTSRSDDDIEDTPTCGFADMKVITTKRGTKAILANKVLNANCKRYKKWRKNDKAVLKAMLTPPLQEMYEDGKIGYRKAKRVRRIVTKRILSCFYGKSK